MSGPMTIALRELVQKTKLDVETVVRKTTIDLLSSVVARSPVGNPDGWKANRGQAIGRETHNVFVEAINNQIKADPKSFTRTGRLKVKLERTKSAAALRKAYPNVTGKGYVGGRFRGNWQVGIGSINEDTSAPPDKSGAAAISRGSSAVTTWKIGSGTIYLTNSLPYAKPLEYGYSRQAPSGMVRLTVQDFNIKVRKAINEVKA